MLTPEQTRLRMYDNELRELKQENTKLREKLSTARSGMATVLRAIAKQASWRDAAEYRKMADELEASGWT